MYRESRYRRTTARPIVRVEYGSLVTGRRRTVYPSPTDALTCTPTGFKGVLCHIQERPLHPSIQLELFLHSLRIIHRIHHSSFNMPPKQAEKKVLIKSDKLTQGEKKKIKNDNKAKANPEKAAAKKEKNDAKRAGRCVVSMRLLVCLSFLIVVTTRSNTPFTTQTYRKESGSVKKLG